MPQDTINAYVTILDGDNGILPFFVRYYRRLGATHFPVIIYDQPDRIAEAHDDARQIIQAEGGEYVNAGGMNEVDFAARKRDLFIHDWHQAHAKNQWAFFADLDEFPQIRPEEIDWWVREKKPPFFVYGSWLDRVAEEGKLVDVVGDRPLEEQYPMKTRIKLRKFINMGGLAYVFCRFPPYHHHPTVCEWGKVRMGRGKQCRVHHFKWQGNALTRLRKRLTRISRSGKKGSEWFRRVRRTVRHLQRHNGVKKGLLVYIGNVLGI